MDLPFSVDIDLEEPGEPLASSILLVDDEEVVLDVLQRLLGREGDLSVTPAKSGEQALEHLRERSFQLLVTDKNLPGISGIELVTEARKLRPAIESILITGYPSGESVLAALAAGASDYLTKPFDDLPIVRAKIRSALERRTHRVKGRRAAMLMAREAVESLQRGRNVPEEIWNRLDSRLAAYEAAIRQGGGGAVLVLGEEENAAALRAAGLEASVAEPSDVRLEKAAVVVIDTRRPDWRALAERLEHASPDVLLVARPDPDVGDLLEAISMHVELVGFGGGAAAALPGRVKGLLLRRAVQKAQESLAHALAEFHGALGG
ncbi:MAG: response regulator [Myxococcales bacterium]|nr:response regulator [Myxococcales bacterium]